MKIAIPQANGQLCAHFGHCEAFAIVDVDDTARTITGVTHETPPPHEPGALPRWLASHGVSVVIAGGMGQRAQQIFAQHGIEVLVGAAGGTAEELAEAYLNGSIETGVNLCDH